ncbi:expressed unknown protein [Seminavis robusta]|uniref:Uncharacterized protein n=1 Tax=Seminavis robusta TaxID=568900 RepID=A0A9N8ERH8_9STRA|nr:expressed unknown protein [Seminavis robusta]|eukprot:Sro1578_g283640.1 n/a (289) ;mRNA; r:8175-9041
MDSSASSSSTCTPALPDNAIDSCKCKKTMKTLSRSVSLDPSMLAGGSSSSKQFRNLVVGSSSLAFSTVRSRTRSDKKKVRFACRPKTRIYYKHDNVDGCLWFNKDDFRQNKKTLEEEGLQWQAKGYDILLKDSYSNPSREQLDTFVQLPGQDYMRGAEPWLCDSLYHQRTFARHRSVEAIIDKEIQLRQMGTKTPEEIAQDLANLYAKLTKPSRDFAKRMGMADELGDKLGENPELPLYILPKKANPNDPSAPKARPSLAATKKARSSPMGSSSLARLVSSMATAMGA